MKVIRPADTEIDGDETTLPDKAMAVLVYLAQHARQVCDRDDILDAVWGPEREAYDRVLDNAIREIRRALGDDARDPKYVQTIPKRGYRLLVPVESRLLEKQRDSSGEFVPVAGGSEAQVFQRVKRKPAADRDSEAPGTGAAGADRGPAEPESATSPAGTALRGPESPRWMRIALISATVVFLALGAWTLGSARSGGLTVAIDASELEAATANSARIPTPEIVTATLRRALFEDHACGSRNLFRPDSALRRADLDVELRRTSSGGEPSGSPGDGSVLSAEILRSKSRGLVLLDAGSAAGTPNSAAKGFAEEIVRSLDQAACRFEQADDLGRACHCLRASENVRTAPNLQTAIEDLELAITLDPDLVPAYDALARAFYATGNLDHGMSVLKTGLAKIEDPDSTEALGLRLQLARLLQDPAEEERLIERLLRRNPDDPRWILAKASFLTYHRRDCRQALRLLEPLLQQTPRSVDVTRIGSLALWLCGESERQVQLIADLVEQLPREIVLRRWFAASLSLVGRYDEAAAYATEAMVLEPGSSDPFWILGLIAERRGHYSTAESWYRKARELAKWPSQEVRVIAGLAEVARMRGDYERCFELLEPLGQARYDEALGLPDFLRGSCLVGLGRLEEAGEILLELTSSPAGQSGMATKPWELLLRAEIRAAGSQTPESRRQTAEDIVAAAEARPVRLDWAYSEAGSALARVGEVERAEDWFEKTLSLNPNHAWTLCRLGMLRQERGELDSAADLMRRGLDVFGPRLEDDLAVRCQAELRKLELGDSDETTVPRP